MNESVVTLTVDTQEDYERRQTFKKGLRQRGTGKKATDAPRDSANVESAGAIENLPVSPMKKAA